MATNTVYLLTGANRGIGLEVAKQLLSKPNVTLIAAVRSPAGAKATLDGLPKGKDSQLIIDAYDATEESSPKTLISSLISKHGVIKIDVLIANSGVQESFPQTLKIESARSARIFQINAVAPFQLANAALELLRKSASPIFAATSSAAAAVNFLPMMPPQMPLSPYGPSKAALNWMLLRLQAEEPWLTIVGVHPGAVMTDMALNMDWGGLSMDAFKDFVVEVEASAKGYLEVLDQVVAKKEEWGGKMVGYDGHLYD